MKAADLVTKSRIKTSDPLHEPMPLTEEKREWFRDNAKDSRKRKMEAEKGLGPSPIYPIFEPRYDPAFYMPRVSETGITSISLFSGGGGLDLGFDLAGYTHVGSWELLDEAAQTIRNNRPDWEVHGGENGDVRTVNWRQYRGVDIVHGGPPCQPFSNAGKQRGAEDPRDMWPEFVRAVKEIKPRVFVAENVPALASSTFSEYVKDNILGPLSSEYKIQVSLLHAYELGVPQKRTRVFFIGFRRSTDAKKWKAPIPITRRAGELEGSGLPLVAGARWALGLPDIGYDDICPTIRSGLTGPRHTTSILNSVSAKKDFEKLHIWPNGVAKTREAAQAFVTKNGDYRLCIDEVRLLQGFPEDWKFVGATYMALGQIGNSVAPPMAYAVAKSVSQALLK